MTKRSFTGNRTLVRNHPRSALQRRWQGGSRRRQRTP